MEEKWSYPMSFQYPLTRGKMTSTTDVMPQYDCVFPWAIISHSTHEGSDENLLMSSAVHKRWRWYSHALLSPHLQHGLSWHIHLQWSQGNFLKKPVPFAGWPSCEHGSYTGRIRLDWQLCACSFFLSYQTAAMPWAASCSALVQAFHHSNRSMDSHLISKSPSDISSGLTNIHHNCFF